MRMFKFIYILSLVALTACSHGYVKIRPVKSQILPVIEDIVDERKEDTPQTRQVTYIPKHKERKLAEITLGLKEGTTTHEYTLEVRRDYRGYLVEAPVLEEDKFKTSIALSRSNEHRYMLGIKLSWRF